MLTTQFHRPQIFETMNSVRSNNLSLKYQRFTQSGCRAIGIKKTETVARTPIPLGAN